MATKKSTSAARKKPATKAAAAPKKTTTKVTTVKAATTPRAKQAQQTKRFSFSRSPLLAASIAEFIGTFLLAAAILVTSNSPLYVLFALVVIVLGVGGLSGAHFNPAITVGAWVTRRVGSVRAVSYLVAQILGALLALTFVNWFFSNAVVNEQAAAFGQASPTMFSALALTAGKEWFILVAELVGVTIFAYAFATAMRMTTDHLGRAFTIGGGFFLALLVAGIAGGQMTATGIFNPAVAISLQAVKWELWPVVIYAVTPLVGGILGFALNDVLHTESEEVVA